MALRRSRVSQGPRRGGPQRPVPQWVSEQFGWGSELKYNAWFSVASSAAFVLVMLVLGWWKLMRIDF